MTNPERVTIEVKTQVEVDRFIRVLGRDELDTLLLKHFGQDHPINSIVSYDIYVDRDDGATVCLNVDPLAPKLFPFTVIRADGVHHATASSRNTAETAIENRTGTAHPVITVIRGHHPVVP